jgi:ribosomal protein S12 methylthiotransferase
VGVFVYSYEADTPSGRMSGQVPSEVAKARRDMLMRKQQRISLARNQRFVGQTLDVLIEGHDAQQGISVGRTYRDAPEVDGLTIIEGTLPVGQMLSVRINGALAYDLVGAPA